MTYKPEIDGLRAIAIILPLLFHMQFDVPGGYVGVDMFFVISGFLITSILVKSLSKESLSTASSRPFSLWSFYGKRILRLYPALLVTAVLTLVAGFFLASPSYLETISRSGKYAVASLANIFFANNLGYFDEVAKNQPFLHTWSLGVEWQFYLIWPLLVWGMLKISRNALLALLMIITLSSVIASQWGTVHNATAAYYLMPYRAFQLGIGALLVFVYDKWTLKPSASVLLTLAGITAILISAFVFTSQTPFPGVAALVPCLGTAACILGAKGFTKGNLLRLAPVVYIGKISYSVYLVHWPLVVLYCYYIFRDLHTIEKYALLITSLVLGAILYTLIEIRITWKKLSNKRVGCAVMLVSIFAIAGTFNYISRQGQGLPWRIADKTLTLPQYNIWGGENLAGIHVLGPANQKPLAFLAGDSLMGNLAYGLSQVTQNQDMTLKLGFAPGCIISTIDTRPQTTNQCRSISAQTLEQVRTERLPLVLAQAWWFLNHAPIDEKYTTQDPVILAAIAQYPAGQYDFMLANLDHIRQQLGGQTLILVGGVPFQDAKGASKECLLRPTYIAQPCREQLHNYEVQSSASFEVNHLLQIYAQRHDNVYYIDINPALCPNGLCNYKEHAKLFSDVIHLSRYGSEQLAPYVVKQIERILIPPQGLNSVNN